MRFIMGIRGEKLSHLPAEIFDLFFSVGDAETVTIFVGDGAIDKASVSEQSPSYDLKLPLGEGVKPRVRPGIFVLVPPVVEELDFTGFTTKPLGPTTAPGFKQLSTSFALFHIDIVRHVQEKVNKYPQRLHAVHPVMGDDIVRSVRRRTERGRNDHAPVVRCGVTKMQIMEDTFMVSGTMDAVKTIGRAEESKYQLEKSLKYLATELEYAMLNNATAVAGDGSTARKTKGLAGWVATNDMSYASYAATNDFDEAKFMAMGQACFKAGGDPSVLLVPPDQARKIAGWDGNSRITVNTNASEKTLVMAVMVLETPFGRVKVTIDLWIAQDTSTDKYDRVFLIDPSKLAVAWLRNIKTTELAKTGDSRKYQTLGEAAFVCYSEKAHAKAYKLATD